ARKDSSPSGRPGFPEFRSGPAGPGHLKVSSRVMSGEPGENARVPSGARGAGLAFAIALAVTLVMAAPVALAPGERLFGSRETFAREDPNRDPFIVMEQFRTAQAPGPSLQPLTALPGRALARLVGPVAAYNVLIPATFPL